MCTVAAPAFQVCVHPRQPWNHIVVASAASCPTAPTVVRDAVLGRQVGILGGSKGCAQVRASLFGAWDRQSGRCGLQRVNL